MALREKYIICILLLAVEYTSGYICNAGFQVSDGYTMPQGDIVLEYGQPLNITCNINESLAAKYGSASSTRLFFKKGDEVLPSEMIQVLNSTSIRLYIENHPKVGSDSYYCWFCYGTMMTNAADETERTRNCDSKNICFNTVTVGVAPQNITDFSCLSRNYQNLTCTWTAKNNYVRTTYNLTYQLQIRSSRPNRRHKRPDTIESNYPFSYNCSNMTVKEGKVRGELHYSCYWDLHTPTQYRYSHEIFDFTLTMSNVFKQNVKNKFRFNNYERVLPNPPENLTAVATSPHSILLSWDVSNELFNFPPGLEHKILYQSEYELNKWHLGAILIDPEKAKQKSHKYELKNLTYANALYDIRVMMRSKRADKNDENMWSQYSYRTVRTKSKLPDCPPNTTLGSFDFESTSANENNFTVYWQQLKLYQRNGQDFHYLIEIEGNPLVVYNATRTGINFVNMPNRDYVIHIWSVNNIGRSVNKSTVFVPSKRLRNPANFIKVETYKDDSQINELTWQPPIESESAITNYTIFWCNSDMQGHCVDDFNWVIVPKDAMKYKKILPKSMSYIFAISANSLYSTSGMNRAGCTINSNGRMGRIRHIHVNDGQDTYIELAWSLECTDPRNPIDGFVIRYCQYKNPPKPSCLSELKTLTIQGTSATRSARVSGLKPYTSYRFEVAFTIQSKISDFSDPVYNVTKEGKPSNVQNIKIIDITNSSISLRWDPPKEKNGHLRRYNVSYNGGFKEVEDTFVTLNNLNSFETYSIKIMPCAGGCTEVLDPINVTTNMWEPGEINRLSDEVYNNTHITLMWEKPKPARGKLNYYLVKFSVADDVSEKYENVTSRNITVVRCREGYRDTPSFAVRAVNILENGEHKPGPWSDERKWQCRLPSVEEGNASFVYILVGIFLIFFAFLMAYCVKKVYIYVIDWRKFDIIMPPGILETKPNIDDSSKSINKMIGDEELRPMMKGGLRSSGDSSGCSSGHESITSSLESTTHILPSDSVTEQPSSPALGEDKKNSLRQRNVPTRPTINKGYVLPDAVQMTNRPPKPTPATGDSYCVFGVDPSNQTEVCPDPAYVASPEVNIQMPFSDISAKPPPYVMTGDITKPSNAGYVPYPVTQPSTKNPGYVLAGLTKDLVPSDLLQCDTPKASVEGKPLFMPAPETLPNIKGVQFPWPQPPVDTSMPKMGYVTVGDAPPPRSMADVTKGYVPHRQFEARSLKED